MESVTNSSGNPVSVSRPAFFTGRDTFLMELRETLLRSRFAVISGVSGAGKTATALEYVYRFSRHYQRIVWINASSAENFLATTLEAVLALDVDLDLNIQEGPAQVFATLHRWLATQPDVLLILDGVALQQITPDLTAGEQSSNHILLISHDPEVPAAIAHRELDRLEAQDGALLLLRQASLLDATATLEEASVEEREYAVALADKLHGSPIALKLAGAYLKASGNSIQDDLQAYRRARNTATRHPQSRRKNQHVIPPVAIACDIILAHLKKEQPRALELARICAFFASDAMPCALFAHEIAHAGFEPQADAQPSAAPLQMIPVLASYGLLAADAEFTTLSMHPLVQTAIRKTLTSGEQQRYIEQALRACYHILFSQEQHTLPTQVRMAGHIRRLATLSENGMFFFDEAAEAFGWAASLLWEQGQVRDAEPLLRRALVIWERTLGHTHPKVATVMLNLAMLNALLKNYAEAETLAQRAIIAKGRALGKNHPDVLLALDNLGHMYAEQDKVQEAKLCYEKALALGDEIGLQNHPFYLTAMYDLALLHNAQGRFNEAEPLLQSVCSAWDLSSDTSDPSTIEAWSQLAEASVQLQNWEKAEVCYQRLQPIYDRLLGEEHLETLHCLEQLANVLLQQGKLEEAENYLQWLLDVKERLLGSEHPDLAPYLNGLAQVALGREQFPEALALLARAQRMYGFDAGSGNLALAKVLDNLAELETIQERYEQALSLLQRALAIREQHLGDEHLDLVENLSNLATLHLTLEQFEQAERLLLRTIAIYQRAQKPEDMALDSALTQLAMIEMNRGHYWQAEMYLERSRSIRALALGDEDLATAEVLQNLALIASAQERWDEAVNLYQRVLLTYESELGEADPQTLECLEQLATIFIHQSQLQNARIALQRILRVREQELGMEAPDLEGNLLALSQVYLAQGQFVEAETCLRRTLTIYNHAPHAEPLGIAFLASGVAAALEGQGKQELAQQARLFSEQMFDFAKPSADGEESSQT